MVSPGAVKPRGPGCNVGGPYWRKSALYVFNMLHAAIDKKWVSSYKSIVLSHNLFPFILILRVKGNVII